jgi:hypothetical protein
MSEIEDMMVQVMQQPLFNKIFINESLIVGADQNQVVDFT